MDDASPTPSEGEVVIITEIMANPQGVSDALGEWIELYNPGASAVSLEGWTLTDASGGVITLEGLTLPAKSYRVLGNNNKNQSNGGVAVDFLYDSSFTLGNEAETLVLASASGAEVDGVAYSKAYEGASVSLDPGRYDVDLNDRADSFCATRYSQLDSGDYGTPGGLNDVCIVSASQGDLVITEIMANPLAVDDKRGEFIEIYNASGDLLKLDGWVLKDGSGDVHTISSGGKLQVAAKKYLILAAHAEQTENGNVEVDYSWGTDLVLLDESDSIQILAGSTVVDAVAYGGTTFPETPTGASIQLDPSAQTSAKNDDGSQWCVSTEAISGGTDKGTPGDANPSCPTTE